jgi:hypothetical protein
MYGSVPSAKARFKEGLDLYKAHKNTEARAKYLQALAVSQAAAIYLNLAIVEYDLLLYPDALRHAKAYVVHPKAEPAKVEKLKKEMIPDLQAKTGHVSVQGQAGEAIFVDGEKVGIAPLADTVDVTPGDHTVVCGAITKTVGVKAGDSATVIVVIETAPAPTGTTGTAPPPVPTTSPTQTPPIGTQNSPVDPPPPDKPTDSGMGKWIGPIALGAVGAGGIVTGIVFAGNSNSARDSQVSIQRDAGGHACADKSSATCKSFDSKGSDANTAQTISAVGYGFGIGAVAAAACWTVLTMRKSGAPATGTGGATTSKVSPWFAPTGGGASLEVTFF